VSVLTDGFRGGWLVSFPRVKALWSPICEGRDQLVLHCGIRMYE